MEKLPDEVVLQILSNLEPVNLRSIQATCRRLLHLSRDNQLWKSICFEQSRFQAARLRKEQLDRQGPALSELRRFFHSPGRERQGFVSAARRLFDQPSNAEVDNENRRTRHVRAFATWDPVYPGEHGDFNKEYLHRHAPIRLDWFRQPAQRANINLPELECIGVGLLRQSDGLHRVVAPLEDGSLCIWDVNADSSRRSLRDAILTKTAAQLLFSTSGLPKKSKSTFVEDEFAVTENVSIDEDLARAYIAYHNQLKEVDLRTLQVVSDREFPFTISALSAAQWPVPVTVGTKHTLHLYDPRIREAGATSSQPTKCEVINAPLGLAKPADLAQPWALSFVHLPSLSAEPSLDSDIWVAGRFTSLLNYDRRMWPRPKGHIFSGARLSSLIAVPRPFIPRELNLVNNEAASLADLALARSGPGNTLIAAGEYKGKGSLELYGIDGAETSPLGGNPSYLNRQTAARSRLLSIAPHGLRYVFSDGDGNMKWVERDGSAFVRQFNINTVHLDLDARAAVESSLFASNHATQPGADDIVQKIVPMVPPGKLAGSTGRLDGDDLLIWTGDGRLGRVGFGSEPSAQDDMGNESEEEATLARQEREYGERMRVALERHADETRFVRGLGMAMGR